MTQQTVGSALREAAALLQEVPDGRLDAEYLLSHILHTDRLTLLTRKTCPLSDGEAAAFDALLRRRAAREPLQYILGAQYFMGFPFRTDPRALIPRWDTEALCEAALAALRPGCRVLDLCTGTGAIALALKKLCPGADVTGTDISPAALSLARENAEALGAEARLLEGDLFAPVQEEVFDVIVCNPPYIPDGLKGTLQKEVEQEPPLALFGGPDGLDFYRRIAREAPDHLRPGGRLYLEIGDGQREAVAALLAPRFQEIQCLTDLSGLPRVIQGSIPSSPSIPNGKETDNDGSPF